MKKTCNVIHLPTDDETAPILRNTYCYTKEHGNPFRLSEGVDNAVDRGFEYQHLYITSDDEVKEGDWILYDVNHLKSFKENWAKGKVKDTSEAGKANCHYGIEYYDSDPVYGVPQLVDWHCGDCKKIIATTDPNLQIGGGTGRREDGVSISLPQIPQSFIQEWCQNPVETVEVEYVKGNELEYTNEGAFYKELPKLNPDNTIVIAPVKEKMYSRDEVESLIFNCCNDIFGLSDKDTLNRFNNWIKESL